MAQTENEARIAQTIADLAAGMDAQEFLHGASEGLGMVLALISDDNAHAAVLANVFAGNAAGHACAYRHNYKRDG